MNKDSSFPENSEELSDLDSLRKLLRSHPSEDKIGRYEVVDFLGQGGMGKVYRAYDPELIRTVAIKVIDWRSNRNVQKKRLLKEAQATARLSHPNIVKLYEIGEDDQNCYLVMEYVEGCNLAQYLKKGIPSYSWTLNILYKISLAVHHSHKEGILHRDLKPANIMIVKDEPKVMDFGLAKVLSDETSASSKGKVVGTVQYMSPEQLRAKKLDERSDIFSLGILFYEMLCGQRPFQGKTTLEVATSIAEQVPIPLKDLDSSIPFDVEAICLKCLQKERQKRYQNANLLAKDIKRYQDFFPVHARKRTLSYVASKWFIRNFSLIRTAAAISIAFILVLVNCYIYFKLQEKEAFLVSKEKFPVVKKELFESYQPDTGKNQEYIGFAIADLWESFSLHEGFGRMEKRIESLKNLFPDSSILHQEAGKIFLLQWIRHKDSSYRTKALENLEKSLACKPWDSETAFCVYQIYFFSQDWQKQEIYSNLLIKENPGYSLYFKAQDAYRQIRLMDKAAIRQKDYDEALAYCQSCLEKLPSFAAAYGLMASIFVMMDAYDQALSYCQKALALKQEKAYSYRFPKYKEIIKKDISFMNLYCLDFFILEGKIYEKTNQYDKALAAYNKVLSSFPSYSYALINRAEIYYKQGELSFAIEDCSKAIEEKYQIARGYSLRGNSYLGLKKYEKAIEDYTSLIQLLPEKSEFYLLRSGVYQEMKQYSKAIADLEQALKLDPKNQKIQFLKTVLYKMSLENTHK